MAPGGAANSLQQTIRCHHKLKYPTSNKQVWRSPFRPSVVEALDTADIIIEVIDDREPKDTELSSSDTAQSVIRVLNKIDLSGRAPGVLNTVDQEDESPSPTVAVSAVTGAGIHDLEQMIIHCLGIGEAETTSPFSARERHVTCLKRAEAAHQLKLLALIYHNQ